jgi:hypothetical protein
VSGYECVRCGCPFHLTYEKDEQGACWQCGLCRDYKPAFAWDAVSVERAVIAAAVKALRKGRDPVVVLRMLEAA